MASLRQNESGNEAAVQAGAAGPRGTGVDLLPIVPLVERIVEKLKPEEIWLFGSRAEGRARPDSDYDLLAVLPDGAPESALDLLKAWELTCGLGVPVDLVPCTRSEFEEEKNDIGTLARAAYHRGWRVYERGA